jgi:hypothetical protein
MIYRLISIVSHLYVKFWGRNFFTFSEEELLLSNVFMFTFSCVFRLFQVFRGSYRDRSYVCCVSLSRDSTLVFSQVCSRFQRKNCSTFSRFNGRYQDRSYRVVVYICVESRQTPFLVFSKEGRAQTSSSTEKQRGRFVVVVCYSNSRILQIIHPIIPMRKQ